MPKDVKKYMEVLQTIAIIKGKGHRKAGSWDRLSNNLYIKLTKIMSKPFLNSEKS